VHRAGEARFASDHLPIVAEVEPANAPSGAGGGSGEERPLLSRGPIEG
jgi:hypothetical protein